MKQLLTIPEVLAATGLGRTKVYEEMNAGRIGYVRVGRRRLVPAQAVMDYVALLVAEQASASDGSIPAR